MGIEVWRLVRYIVPKLGMRAGQWTKVGGFKTAARTRDVFHDRHTRQKIQTTQLLNRLKKHAFAAGDLMTLCRVTAALAVLRKSLPDLQAIKMKADVSVTIHEDALAELE